jgi:hypothetical protein
MSYVGNKPAQTTIPADDAVTTAMLKDDAVTSAKIDDGTIATADIADDAVTVDKVANAINTSIAANTAKVTNATHTGDVTGATALTIATDAVDIAMLSATGTASASTFLRGDNAWAAVPAGGITHASIWDMTVNFTGDANPITTNWLESNSVYSYSTLGASMTESSGVFTFPATGYWLLSWNAMVQLESAISRYCFISIHTTTDDSTYVTAAENSIALYNGSGWAFHSGNITWLFDVTNVSTHKCQFGMRVANSSVTTTQSMNNGTNDPHKTAVTFIRLADT